MPFSFVFFLFSLRRRICSPFSSTIFLALLAQASSDVILFVENHYMNQFFFFHRKIFNEKNLLADFFLEVQRFPGRTKIADFRKNADNWKHCSTVIIISSDPAHLQ